MMHGWRNRACEYYLDHFFALKRMLLVRVPRRKPYRASCDNPRYLWPIEVEKTSKLESWSEEAGSKQRSIFEWEGKHMHTSERCMIDRSRKYVVCMCWACALVCSTTELDKSARMQKGEREGGREREKRKTTIIFVLFLSFPVLMRGSCS